MHDCRDRFIEFSSDSEYTAGVPPFGPSGYTKNRSFLHTQYGNISESTKRGSLAGSPDFMPYSYYQLLPENVSPPGIWS